MSLPFAKLHGAGNDYIAIDGRDEDRDWGRLSAAMSRLHFGVGSDGIVVATPSEKADIRMRIFNPDGSEAEMSGNGVRLFSKFVIDRKMAAPGRDGLKVETLAGIRTVTPRMEDDVMVAGRVAMGEPAFRPGEIPVASSALGDQEQVKGLPLKVDDHQLRVTCLSVGNPHAVAFVDDVEAFPLDEVGPQVERHPFFPNRVNFEIADVLDRGRVRARIFERGAGETLSSGTGTSAVCIAAKLHGYTDDAIEVMVPGGTLKLTWPGHGEVYLEGPTVEVFTGVWPD